MRNLARLWRTVRWLRREQWLGRARLLWRLRVARPRPDLAPAPPQRPWPGPWTTPTARAASLVGPGRFRLLEQEHELDARGWDHPDLPLLWRYNQHYFDDLNAASAAARRPWHEALLQRWMRENAPGAGTAWAPYPTSLRIVNWIKWLRSAAPVPHSTDLDHSLAVQARWLAASIEWHLLGNHLFANAKALVFAGCHFSGPESEIWLRQGLAIIERELPEQILADGGHFERSPMYHALALEDLLDLINVLRASAEAESLAMGPSARLLHELIARAASMRRWLAAMAHADGSFVRFNDCAEGIAPAAGEFDRLSLGLGLPAVEALPPGAGQMNLEPSGYLRWSAGTAVAWLDLAPVGPDYLPGHAHADTLSFELAVRGLPVVVNRGTSVYGDGPRRQWERGTAAHSTVQIDQADSSEVWAGFRVGRRARVQRIRSDAAQITAAHDGYAHRSGGPIHERSWRLDDQRLTVDDQLRCARSPMAVARFHLAPGLRVGPAHGARLPILSLDGSPLAEVTVETGHVRITSTEHAVRFGRTEPAMTLEVELIEGRSRVHFGFGLD